MIKPVIPVVNHPFNDSVLKPVTRCLGSRIQHQMYHGVSSGNSTLLTGQYDDEDSFDVDPACDMSTDRFEIRPDSHAFDSRVDNDSSSNNSE